MNQYEIRKKAIRSALGSVRLEYMRYEPSDTIKQDMEDWAEGKITAAELREKTVKRIKEENNVKEEQDN